MPANIVNRLKRLDSLIQHKATGTPKELARKLNISERSLFRYINIMKELNAPVAYNHERRCYYYTENGELTLTFIKQ